MAIICCIRYFQCIRHSLVSSLYYGAHHGWARRNFQNKGSQMAGKRYLEIKVCKYSVTGESFCSSLKQNLQKVYYELNLQSSEDCPLAFLMEMRSNFRVYNP